MKGSSNGSEAGFIPLTKEAMDGQKHVGLADLASDRITKIAFWIIGR